jgi:flagellar motor switch protein FliN
MANDGVVQLLANELANDLVRSIEGMTGDAPSLSLVGTGGGIQPGALTWRQRFNASRGSAWLSADSSVWIEIGARTLRAAGIEENDPETAKGTFVEILGQAFAMLARAISGRMGEEWTCTEGGESAGMPQSGRWTEVELAFGDGYRAAVLIAFEDALVRALDRPDGSGAVAVAGASGTVAAAPAAATSLQIPTSKTLELLLDVELPVSVSFGRAQLPLKDVIKLTTGSIVELNRTVAEPVEVIVNNCVIARGEVVVVEGNFGVRIQQVVSREERLRTLF